MQICVCEMWNVKCEIWKNKNKILPHTAGNGYKIEMVNDCATAWGNRTRTTATATHETGQSGEKRIALCQSVLIYIAYIQATHNIHRPEFRPYSRALTYRTIYVCLPHAEWYTSFYVECICDLRPHAVCFPFISSRVHSRISVQSFAIVSDSQCSMKNACFL